MGTVTKVTANFNGNTYNLNKQSGNTYSDVLSAPLKTSVLTIAAEDDYGNIATNSDTVIEIDGEWYSPKTDWSGEWSGNTYIGDYFTYIDYNRIKNNIMFLIAYASQMYNVTDYNFGDDKKEADLLYADEINLFETATKSINAETYNFPYVSKTWKENGYVPNADDWNRLEKMALKLHGMLVAQREAQNSLAFTLGGQKGFKV